jgi:formylglycine-generating enzyme required for sulfatase activity
VKLQTLQAGELVERALAADRAATALIFQRRLLGAAEKLAESAALVMQAEREFPRSRRELGPLKLKLAYLELRRPDHAALQDEVYAHLLPLPVGPGRLMLRTEVTQALYGRVMNTNPSRHPGPARPVDSVAWGEAQEFCRRLGWLLGTAVRLPTEAEFHQALGRDRGPAWSAEASAGQTHPTGEFAANANGSCDLLGNVAEWLHADDDGPARVAGGSYLDSAEALAALPVGPVDKATRARHLGFRVVVEFPIE